MSPAPTHSDVNLLGKSLEELRALAEAMGEPAYRGGQIYRALYAEKKFDWPAMTNLPAGMRGRLESETVISLPRILRTHRSADGTVRYVLALGSQDGAPMVNAATVETVFMP